LGEGRDVAAVHACALDGLGGIGKTSVAVAYSHRFRAYYDTMIRIGAEDTAVVDNNLAALATEFGVPSDEPEQRIGRLWHALRRPGRTLVIFDNAATEQSLQPWWPSADSGADVLVTSRSAGWSRAVPVRVELLSGDDAVKLLCTTGHNDDAAGA